MNKFKTENDTGPDAPWVLICGPSAIQASLKNLLLLRLETHLYCRQVYMEYHIF